jgi:hypothetical protein
VRALTALGFALALWAGVGCASGNNCADKGGTCTQAGVCPSGTQPPTVAELEAAGTQSTAYACPSFVDAGTDLPICCLKIPASN